MTTSQWVGLCVAAVCIAIIGVLTWLAARRKPAKLTRLDDEL